MNGEHLRQQLNALDARLDPDLAWEQILRENRYAGAERFERRCSAHIVSPFVDLLAKPDKSSPINSQVLSGSAVDVLGKYDRWFWIEVVDDAYVGWADCHSLSLEALSPDYKVVVPGTFRYPGPDMKLPRCAIYTMGSGVSVAEFTETGGTKYAVLEDGSAMIADHLVAIDQFAPDYVAVAEKLMGMPYLWGGNTAMGIDCSGLVQLAMKMAGSPVLRDSDMQSVTIGEAIDPGDAFAQVLRGDLVFWNGHVAIVTGSREGRPWIVHANGHTMTVALEPLDEAIERIAFLYDRPTGVRRPSICQVQ